VFILRGLRARFLEVRILKGLTGSCERLRGKRVQSRPKSVIGRFGAFKARYFTGR
jgi:hypothetical protein